MSNNITDRLKYKESIVKFSRKYGVEKAAYKFGECKRTIYRWKKDNIEEYDKFIADFLEAYNNGTDKYDINKI